MTRKRAMLLVATGFGAGYVAWAPGTAGSVVGLLWWWAITPLPAWLMGMAIGVTLPVAVITSGLVAKALDRKDPECVVIDEIVAVPIALAGATGWWPLLAFGLFRLFDIWKPWPIRQSQALPGGWGIVADDLLAAGAACGFTHLAMAGARAVF